MSLKVGEVQRAGCEAAERCAWTEAFALLAEADAAGELNTEGLERLGESSFWTGHVDDAVRAWERVHALHIETGNRRRAANAALELASLHNYGQNSAVAAGWFYKATDLLAGEPECPEHGRLAWIQAWLSAFLFKDLDAALGFADQAFAIGRRVKDRDIEAVALNIRGTILALQGHLDQGLALLDQSMASAVGGALGPFATGQIYCATVKTCHWFGDLRRAGQWSDEVKRCASRPGMTDFPGDCRVHRAGVLRLRGLWAEAEGEATRACVELHEMDHHHMGEAFYEIGEVRLRMGDLSGAETAFQRSREYGRDVMSDPQPGLAQLRLLQGKVDEAAASIGATLAAEDLSSLDRAPLLSAGVEICLTAGNQGTARSHADELKSVAASYPTPVMRAYAACAEGELALDRGDAQEALNKLRLGLRAWQEIGAPYEMARVRVQIAGAYRALGMESECRSELEAAAQVFERLGAVPDANRAAALLGAPRKQPTGTDRVTRTFMFTDIVGSTDLIVAIGDDAWCELLAWHDKTLTNLFRVHAGEQVKQVGDGFFVAFESAHAALGCAMDVQRTLGRHRAEHGFAPRVRIGIHGAEATRSSGDYSGRAVNEAARISALAQGDQVLVSTATLADGGSGFKASGARSVALKGLPQEVEIAEIDWR